MTLEYAASPLLTVPNADLDDTRLATPTCAGPCPGLEPGGILQGLRIAKRPAEPRDPPVGEIRDASHFLNVRASCAVTAAAQSQGLSGICRWRRCLFGWGLTATVSGLRGQRRASARRLSLYRIQAERRSTGRLSVAVTAPTGQPWELRRSPSSMAPRAAVPEQEPPGLRTAGLFLEVGAAERPASAA
jgi:hypothetical protein